MTTTVEVAPVLRRIVITPARPELDAHGRAVLHDVHECGLAHVTSAASGRIFFLQGTLSEAVLRRIAEELLTDPITERFAVQAAGAEQPREADSAAVVEVHLKGGVMDPVADSTRAAIADMGIDADGLEVSTGRLYRFEGVRSIDELTFIARRVLSNDCIEDVYLSGFGRDDPRPTHLPVAPSRPFELRHVAIRELDDDRLRRLSRDGHLFLSLEEMRTIRDYYREQQRDPTDLELETFAQTWSEHCVHKTLKSSVRYRGAAFPPSSSASRAGASDGVVDLTYENLLRDTIARATRTLIDGGRVDWCLSVFEDNAGIIVFDETYGAAFKVETHNHPSAIEPYGGAATGIGGCIRDIMGCGLGARPVANTDVFCVARPDFEMDMLPRGVLHPRRVLKGVVAGVRDYGNRMGIPTVNGAVVFDDRYLGNPLVFCGCVGLIPRDRIHKEPQPGDLVVVIGGRTGRDGIHGATFSSAELTDTHADEFSHAVQIGNAITEKKVLDAMLQARDHADGCLYTAVTDCGAGGLSSAVGEMGSELGATVDLEKVPLKYAGLRYDEIWISEAQERMVLSVPPANWEKLRAICEAENVEATAIGAFRDDGRLLIRYDGQTVGELDAGFLHNGVPRTRKEAVWEPRSDAVLPDASRKSGLPPEAEERPAGSRSHNGSRADAESRSAPASDPEAVRRTLLERLADLNAASREWIIRQYDHEVQGGSVVKPLTGPGEGPSDAAVIRPRLDSDRGIAIANGIAPGLADVDPYWMAVAGIDEAVRNIVCVGGDPDRIAILDNFCWGNCEDPQVMGALVRACQGCHDAAVTYGTPFISGKDSLNNEFALDAEDAARLGGRIRLHNNRIRIPETLLISAIGIVDDVRRCVTMDARPPSQDESFFVFAGLASTEWPAVNLAHAVALHREVSAIIRSGKVLAAHDCGDDGILPALAEMAFAGRTGIICEGLAAPFVPVTSGYMLQVADVGIADTLRDRLDGAVVVVIGRSSDASNLSWKSVAGGTMSVDLETLSRAWRSGLNW